MQAHPQTLRRWPATCLPLAAPSAEVEVDDATGAVARGCGWFDSSLDLQRGLRVCECAPTEAALPLAWWLHWQTRGLACAQPGSVATARLVAAAQPAPPPAFAS